MQLAHYHTKSTHVILPEFSLLVVGARLDNIAHFSLKTLDAISNRMIEWRLCLTSYQNEQSSGRKYMYQVQRYTTTSKSSIALLCNAA